MKKTIFLFLFTICAMSQNTVSDRTGKAVIVNAPATTTAKGVVKLAGDLSGNADIPRIADGAITDSKVATGINKTKVGLSNVDNTSDVNKPVSIATQTALDTKENTSNKSTATTLGTSNVLFPTQNAVKTYVDTQLTTKSLTNYTTAGRTAITNPTAGMQIFNTDRQCVEMYDGTDWCCDDFYPLNTEVRTSKKFNGKAVFRKIFTGTTPNAPNESFLFTVTECTGQIINYEGWVIQNGFNRRVSLESIYSGSVFHGPLFQFHEPASGTTLQIRASWSNVTGDVRWQNCAYTITVEYTKN